MCPRTFVHFAGTDGGANLEFEFGEETVTYIPLPECQLVVGDIWPLLFFMGKFPIA